ncbi:sensor histidine kinase [Amycolatopsis anabasis]|uniref:sensor histidine kinase n=1 Tax=Amycolatopsis anabasis TaxID=1840409 RepID=UPI00131AE0E0|nr:histidine kinase [Amycolatopsis anabasis]
MRDVSGSLTRQSLLVAGVCLVADVGLFLIAGPPLGGNWRAWVVLAGLVAFDAALAAPARFSGLVAAGHAVLLVVSPLLLCKCGFDRVPDNAGVLIAGYRAGAWLRTPQGLAALAVVCGGLTASQLIVDNRSAHDWRLLVINVLVTAVLPWLVGRYTTARSGYLEELDRQAERRRHDEQEAVRRAVTEERSAIARDLHDVISHHVSAIGVHAGAARLGLSGDSAQVRRSLSAVESASRSAMVDLRRLLDLLHGQDTRSQRQPGLGNLDELLDGLRSAGLPVRFTRYGTARELPGSLDIALYRIAQEALTNALRHGDGGPVEVELAFRQTEVSFTVTNPVAPDRPPATPGEWPHLGLTGIRQRVALFGGEVAYGPRPDDRWQIRVSFPLEVP